MVIAGTRSHARRCRRRGEGTGEQRRSGCGARGTGATWRGHAGMRALPWRKHHGQRCRSATQRLSPSLCHPSVPAESFGDSGQDCQLCSQLMFHLPTSPPGDECQGGANLRPPCRHGGVSEVPVRHPRAVAISSCSSLGTCAGKSPGWRRKARASSQALALPAVPAAGCQGALCPGEMEAGAVPPPWHCRARGRTLGTAVLGNLRGWPGPWER